MATIRNTYLDFIRDVAARSNAALGLVYSAALNSDNCTLSITRNGVKVYSKIFWNVQGSAASTDASFPNQDTVTIIDPGSGNASVGAAQAFINSLT